MDVLSWAANAGTSRIKGKVLYSNLNTCFEFGAAFVIFFSTPTHKEPRRQETRRGCAGVHSIRQTEGAKNYELEEIVPIHCGPDSGRLRVAGARSYGPDTNYTNSPEPKSDGAYSSKRREDEVQGCAYQ